MHRLFYPTPGSPYPSIRTSERKVPAELFRASRTPLQAKVSTRELGEMQVPRRRPRKRLSAFRSPCLLRCLGECTSEALQWSCRGCCTAERLAVSSPGLRVEAPSSKSQREHATGPGLDPFLGHTYYRVRVLASSYEDHVHTVRMYIRRFRDFSMVERARVTSGQNA